MCIVAHRTVVHSDEKNIELHKMSADFATCSL